MVFTFSDQGESKPGAKGEAVERGQEKVEQETEQNMSKVGGVGLSEDWLVVQ